MTDGTQELKRDVVHIFAAHAMPGKSIEDGGYRMAGLSVNDLERVDMLMQLIQQEIVKEKEQYHRTLSTSVANNTK